LNVRRNLFLRIQIDRSGAHAHIPHMAIKRIPRPRDPLALAKLIGDIATGQVVDAVEDGKDEAAVALGRKGGLVGGKARAAALTPEERREAAHKAIASRWKSKND
jgi:hypothetical protein